MNCGKIQLIKKNKHLNSHSNAESKIRRTFELVCGIEIRIENKKQNCVRNLASCGIAHSKLELKNMAEFDQVCGMKILRNKT